MVDYNELWFDDNHSNIYDVVYPILKRRKMAGHLGIVVDFINKVPYMTIDQIIELVDRGWGIGSHSLTHKNLTEVSLIEAEMEIKASKFWIESLIGITPNIFVFPFNAWNKELENIALKYYEKVRPVSVALFHCKDWILDRSDRAGEEILQTKELPSRERTASKLELELFKKLIEKHKIVNT